MTTVIKVNQVTQSFGNEEVLSEINLEMKEREIYGLLGPSGSGETTLVKIMIGLLKPDSGTVFINETKMPFLDKLKDVGYMTQYLLCGIQRYVGLK